MFLPQHIYRVHAILTTKGAEERIRIRRTRENLEERIIHLTLDNNNWGQLVACMNYSYRNSNQMYMKQNQLFSSERWKSETSPTILWPFLRTASWKFRRSIVVDPIIYKGEILSEIGLHSSFWQYNLVEYSLHCPVKRRIQVITSLLSVCNCICICMCVHGFTFVLFKELMKPFWSYHLRRKNNFRFKVEIVLASKFCFCHSQLSKSPIFGWYTS